MSYWLIFIDKTGKSKIDNNFTNVVYNKATAYVKIVLFYKDYRFYTINAHPLYVVCLKNIYHKQTFIPRNDVFLYYLFSAERENNINILIFVAFLLKNNYFL